MRCLVGGQWSGKSAFFRLLAGRGDGFSDDLKRLDDENVYRKMQGHWIIEMFGMITAANAKSIEEIKAFLSRQKETYKVPDETHPADRQRQCVFCGSFNTMDFLLLDRTGNRRFVPVQHSRSSVLGQGILETSTKNHRARIVVIPELVYDYMGELFLEQAREDHPPG